MKMYFDSSSISFLAANDRNIALTHGVVKVTFLERKRTNTRVETKQIIFYTLV